MKSSFADSATQCLQADHRQLDVKLLESERAAGEGKFSEASELFAAFASGLGSHIDAEEHVLFPVLEELERGAMGPMSVMRAEHEELRVLLEHIGARLAAEASDWRASFPQLKEILLAHNTKEERMLYPMADRAAQSAGRSSALAERLRSALEGHSS
jgi:iron-sulfur cluster repair protein YtfE (RIC family)